MKKTLVILLGLMGTTLAGCPKPYTWSCPTLSSKDNKLSSSPNKIIVQIDGTPSMQGFVSNQNSRYIRTLRLLRSSALSAFPSTTSPAFYVFGTQRSKEIISHEDAETPGLYSGSRPELRDAATYKMIKPQDSDPQNSLYVIVTDLYQEKAQWEDLAANLKDNYLLKEGYAVGIVAIKSEFLGTIYDVGLNKQKYPNVRTNHPFYVLVLGSYSQVKKYFDEIKSGSKETKLNFPDENFVIFTTQIFEQPTLLNIQGNDVTLATSSKSSTNEKPAPSSKSNPINQIRRVEIINDGNVVINFDPNSLQNIERLMVTGQTSSDSPKEVNLEYNIDYNSLPYTLSLVNSLSYRLNKTSAFNQNTENFKELSDNNLSKIMELTNSQFTSNNKFKFDALINLENNPQNIGVYWLVFDILPAKTTASTTPYQAPSWWKSWSFGEGQFVGDKTYNLEPFIYNLGDTTFRIIEDKPEFALGRVCFAIQKK